MEENTVSALLMAGMMVLAGGYFAVECARFLFWRKYRAATKAAVKSLLSVMFLWAIIWFSFLS